MGASAIELTNVTKNFKGFELKSLSFEVKKGFITGFIGPNGSGKTTTIKLIMNLLQADNGKIKVFGKELITNEEEIKERIGFVYAENYFYNHLTVKQTANLFSSFYRNWSNETFSSYIDFFQLPWDKKVQQLSTGMKVKLSLSVALSHSADLIILDEPTTGLDPVVRREVLDILYNVIQDEEKTILFSSHITNDLEKIADYVVFINNGELVFSEPKDDLFERYKIIKGANDLLDEELKKLFVSIRETAVGFEGLTANHETFLELFGDKILIEPATLEDIMVFTVKGETHASITL